MMGEKLGTAELVPVGQILSKKKSQPFKTLGLISVLYHSVAMETLSVSVINI